MTSDQETSQKGPGQQGPASNPGTALRFGPELMTPSLPPAPGPTEASNHSSIPMALGPTGTQPGLPRARRRKGVWAGRPHQNSLTLRGSQGSSMLMQKQRLCGGEYGGGVAQRPGSGPFTKRGPTSPAHPCAPLGLAVPQSQTHNPTSSWPLPGRAHSR